MPRYRLAVLGLVVALTSVACAPTIQGASANIAKGATPAVIEASVAAAEDPKTEARVAAALGKPDTQKALQELSAGVTQGVVEGLTNEEMGARLDQLVHRLTKALLASLGPDAAQMAGVIASQVVHVMAKDIPAELGPALRQTLKDDLGPAMRDMMREDLAPGVADMMKSPQMQAALASTTRELARQAVLGSNDALTELQEKQKANSNGGPLGSASSFFAQRTWLVAALAVALVMSLPLWWLLRERKRSRRYKLDAERRHARAAAILTAMDMASEGHLSPKVLSLVRDQLVEDALGAVGSPQTSMAPVAEPPSRRGGRNEAERRMT